MDVRTEVIQSLIGPGGPFELTTEEVLGQPATVFCDRMRSLREMVANTAGFAEREFLVLEDQRLTFDDFTTQVAEAATALQRRGIGRGDRVGIFAANCPEWVVAFFAATSIGAIVSAYNGWWTADEVDFATALSEPALVIADRPRLDRSGVGATDAPCLVIGEDWDDFVATGAGARLSDIDVTLAEDDPAVILFTSGTTGRPKGAVASHRGLIGFVQSTMLNGAVRVLTEQRINPPRGALRLGRPAIPIGHPGHLTAVPRVRSLRHHPHQHGHRGEDRVPEGPVPSRARAPPHTGRGRHLVRRAGRHRHPSGQSSPLRGLRHLQRGQRGLRGRPRQPGGAGSDAPGLPQRGGRRGHGLRLVGVGGGHRCHRRGRVPGTTDLVWGRWPSGSRWTSAGPTAGRFPPASTARSGPAAPTPCSGTGTIPRPLGPPSTPTGG